MGLVSTLFTWVESIRSQGREGPFSGLSRLCERGDLIFQCSESSKCVEVVCVFGTFCYDHLDLICGSSFLLHVMSCHVQLSTRDFDKYFDLLSVGSFMIQILPFNDKISRLFSRGLFSRTL